MNSFTLTPPGSPTTRFTEAPASPIASSVGSPMCPNAPLHPKPQREAKSKPYWQTLKSSGKVRQRFLFYTPEDVEEIDDYNTLFSIYSSYYFASDYPQNEEEESYLNIMCLRCFDKMYRIC